MIYFVCISLVAVTFVHGYLVDRDCVLLDLGLRLSVVKISYRIVYVSDNELR